jgi:hypothetical protein
MGILDISIVNVASQGCSGVAEFDTMVVRRQTINHAVELGAVRALAQR